jgi:GTPase SAR1 family protein
MDDDDEVVFKIVVIGSVSTGKTNLATRYVRNEYTDVSKATIGV